MTDWAAILSALAGVSATVFILLQLRHMEQHRNLEISMKLFEWAESERLRRAFRWVEEEFQFESYEEYKTQVDKSFEVSDYPYEVEAFFEEVGFFVVKRYVDFDIIVDRLGPNIISDWKRLEPWIFALRKERGDETFGEHFQKLYQKTIAFMEQR